MEAGIDNAKSSQTNPAIEFQTSGEQPGWQGRPLSAPELAARSAAFDRMLPGHYSFRLEWKDTAGQPHTVETEGDVLAGGALDLSLAP